MKSSVLICLFMFLGVSGNAQVRKVLTLDSGWKFINEGVAGAEDPLLSTENWETVEVPHDWAIKGPFDKDIDAQLVKVQQDLDTIPRKRLLPISRL